MLKTIRMAVVNVTLTARCLRVKINGSSSFGETSKLKYLNETKYYSSIFMRCKPHCTIVD